MQEMTSATSRTLALSTCLHRDYIIEGVLGEGGFGITYIGRHLPTDKIVAIKEYFPHKFAVRTEDNSLRSFPGDGEMLFLKGRQHFYKEANILKEFQYIDSVVSVYEVLEENNTAYIIMEYIQGPTLEQYVNEKGVISFSELIPLFTPIIHALSIIHEKKHIHRDISPDNLILDRHNCLHLIDFGAANPEDITGHRNTVMLKSGYAPPEQYLPDSKIGAWVDIYALCATMFFALIGNPPMAAIHRIDSEDISSPLVSLTDLLPWQRAALEKGLSLQPAKRFDNMNDLYCALTIPPDRKEAATIMENSTDWKGGQKFHRFKRRQTTMPLLLAAIFFLALIGSGLIRYAKKSVPTQQKNTVSHMPTVSSDRSEKVSQSPFPLETARSKEKVVSAPLLSMPDISGMPLSQAKKMLKNLDSTITVKTDYVHNNKTKKGWVISQSVAKDAVFSEGHLASVLLTVSLGKEPPKKTDAASDKTIEPAPKKSSSPDYKMKPEDEDYITIPLE